MTKEELLRQRYKCIAIDTTEAFQVGEILNHPPEWHDYIWATPTGKIIFHPENYPHLFEPLPWWKDRKPEDMPEYVYHLSGAYKIIKWTSDSTAIFYDAIADEESRVMFAMKEIMPISKDEYEVYLQTTNQLKDRE